MTRVFEGCFDLLSALADHKKDRFGDGNVIVLNSLSLLDRAIARIQAETTDANLNLVWSYLDRDKAGQEATAKIITVFDGAHDQSILYDGFKDYSEYWTEKVMRERLDREHARARRRELESMDR
jgi:Toprim-like